MYDDDLMHALLDRTLEELQAKDLAPLRRQRLEAAEECIYTCMENRSLTVKELWYITAHIYDYFDPPDPELNACPTKSS